MLKRYRVRDYDFKLIILLAAVTVIGIFSIGSAKVDVQNKQILGFVMGFFIKGCPNLWSTICAC